MSITAFGACGVYDARMQDSTNHDCQWDAEKNDFLCHAVTISKTGRTQRAFHSYFLLLGAKICLLSPLPAARKISSN